MKNQSKCLWQATIHVTLILYSCTVLFQFFKNEYVCVLTLQRVSQFIWGKQSSGQVWYQSDNDKQKALTFRH